MKDSINFLRLFCLMFLFLFSVGLSAKKVICIDDNGDANDGFLNGHEGWERQEAGPDDVIIKGGTLTACMANLADGDTLVIVAHGNNEGEGFEWGGMVYSEFGAGDGEMPLPDGFDGLDIHIKFCTCWSARDPDGPGVDNPDTPLTDKLKDAAGDSSTAEGFPDYSQPNLCVTWVNGNVAQCKAANDALKKDPSWLDQPPHNRTPAPNPSDKSAAQAIVTAIDPTITLNIVYKAPTNVTDEADNSGGVTTGCACPSGCGLYHAMFEGADPIDVLSESNQPVPLGLWRQDDQMDFMLPDGSGILVRNIRMVNNQFDPIPPGDTGPIPFDYFVEFYFQYSIDNGDFWFENQHPGVMQGIANPLPFGGPDQYFELIFDQFAIFSMPITGFDLEMNPTFPAIGVTGVTTNFDESFTVDSFFDISYALTFKDGTAALGCAPTNVHLQCGFPGSGCTNMDSANFAECSVANDGNCTSTIVGCTFPAASNYNANATQENGSCVFHGCTDPAANNYNPLANTDNESCDYSVVCLTDVDQNGVTNTSDLLDLLAAFGLPCSP